MAKEAIGSRYQKDPKKIELIKRAYLDAHDALVESGEFPSLRRVLKALPFWVNEWLGTEIRRQLVESGDLEAPTRGNPKAAAAHLVRLGIQEEGGDEWEGSDMESRGGRGAFVKLDDVVVSARTISVRYHAHEASYALEAREAAGQGLRESEAAEVRRGALVNTPVVDGGPSTRDVARWAVRRYAAAWRSIRTARSMEEVQEKRRRVHVKHAEPLATNSSTPNDLLWGEDWEEAS